MDVDYLTTQGFWICFVVAAITAALSVASGAYFGILDALFFYLGGNGVRQRSLTAAISVFLVYSLSSVVVGGNAYGGPRILICGLLLANVRAIWIASRWRSSGSMDESPAPLSETIGDKLCDLLPAMVWPKTRVVFYIFAVLEIAALGLAVVRLWGR